MPVQVLITRLDPDAVLPARAHPGDAGYDLVAIESKVLAPGDRVAIRTGVAIALPDGYVALVHPRSGLALRHGVTVVNAPGTVDAGYRGEIKVLLVNLDPRNDVVIDKGERIAQLVVQRVEMVAWEHVAELPGSHRGGGGFGSTGS